MHKEIKGLELQIKRVEVNPHQSITAQTHWLRARLAALGIIENDVALRGTASTLALCNVDNRSIAVPATRC